MNVEESESKINQLEKQIINLEDEFESIKQRNSRVEADKAWEVSFFRTASVGVITYLITAVVFYFIGVEDFLRNALIPTVGYLLSTQSIPVLKKWWLQKKK